MRAKLPRRALTVKGLNIRDKNLLRYLFENKVASLKQINRDIFTSTAEPNVIRRLKTLNKAGFIDKYGYCRGWRMIQVFGVSKKALNEYVQNEVADVSGQILKSYAFEHDLELIDIRRHLSHFKSVESYVTENLLQFSSNYQNSEIYTPFVDVRCDALCEVSVTGGTGLVPVEYEANVKFHQRYVEKLGQYYSRKAIDGVLFIAKNKSILKTVSEIEKEFTQKHEPKMYYLLLKDLYKSKGSVTFKNQKGEPFCLN